MIIIIAKNEVYEENISDFQNEIKELIEESRKEKGCISYDLYQDINNPSVLTLIEKWENETAIELHNKSNHFKELVPKLAKYVRQKDINLYQFIM